MNTGEDGLATVPADLKDEVADMTPNQARPNRSAIILAGGMSSRFGTKRRSKLSLANH